LGATPLADAREITSGKDFSGSCPSDQVVFQCSPVFVPDGLRPFMNAYRRFAMSGAAGFETRGKSSHLDAKQNDAYLLHPVNAP